MPSPKEILHNRMDERPSQPSTPVDIEDIQIFLKDKNRHKRNTTTEGIGPWTDHLLLSPEGPSDNYISNTMTSTAPNLRYIGEHQICQYHKIKHHRCASNFSKHCPIMRPSQPPQESSTQPARKKITHFKTIHYSNHRKHAGSPGKAIPRPSSMTNKTTNKSIVVITGSSHTIMHSKAFFTSETHYPHNRTIHSSHHKCKQL